MIYSEFIQQINQLKTSNPLWFELQADPPGTKADIASVEKQLDVSLPEEYQQFVKLFGGGYFAFTVVYSVAAHSQWNIIRQNQILNLWHTQGFIAFSDNHAGDYYGYMIENGLLSERIYEYDHETEQVNSTKYRNLYAFLMEVGLRQISR